VSKNLLIFGGSHSELPLIRAAKRLGFFVTTSGNRSHHPGHKLAQSYFPADFSDPEQMCDVAERCRCEFVVSAANDFAYLSACEVADRLSFPGFDRPEVAYSLHHKHLFKPLAASLGIPVTKFVVIKDDTIELPQISNLSFPLMVKPVDLTGGKGISKVSSKESLIPAMALARSLSKSPAIVVEEFFGGTLHSYSTIIINGKVVFEYSDNEFCDVSPYLVTTSTSQATVRHKVLVDLRQHTEKLATALHLTDGILHCQFLYEDGNYVVLEYTRRCSGDLYSDVVEAVTGVRHAEQFIRQSVGLPLDLSRGRPVSKYVSRYCVFPNRAGQFGGISVTSELLPHVYSVTDAVPHGHEFSSDEREKAAVIITKFQDRSSMDYLSARFNQLVDYRPLSDGEDELRLAWAVN
jgi:biotin carboxylase